MVKNLPAGTGDPGGVGSVSALGRCPGGGNGRHSVVLPGESHGQGSLGDPGPYGHQ